MSINISVDTVIGEFGVTLNALTDEQNSTIGLSVAIVYDDSVIGIHDFSWDRVNVSWFMFFAGVVKWAKSRCIALAFDRDIPPETLAAKIADRDFSPTNIVVEDESDPSVPL